MREITVTLDDSQWEWIIDGLDRFQGGQGQRGHVDAYRLLRNSLAASGFTPKTTVHCPQTKVFAAINDPNDVMTMSCIFLSGHGGVHRDPRGYLWR